jgi:hypothetical protein
MSDKIKPHHLARKAILYVRQSSAHQVLHSRESQALQYAMRDRLVALGWSEVDTVDDDLGRSAAGGVTRVGFERMVAEVCLGKVGAVAAREVSRFARNSRDWQQLIEMCRVVDTVLIDQEMVYAPRQGNVGLTRFGGHPEAFARGCYRCPEHTRRTRLSFAVRWWISSMLDVILKILPASLSRPANPFVPGSPTPTGTRAGERN